MTELLGKSKEELREFCVALGEPAFRGAQIYHALYSKENSMWRNYESSSGTASAALERGADYASGGEAAVCLDGWFGKVFVWPAA